MCYYGTSRNFWETKPKIVPEEEEREKGENSPSAGKWKKEIPEINFSPNPESTGDNF